MTNTGKEYELFVQKIQQALINAEECVRYKNITVERDKKIVDNCGISRQFDIYWEYELGGMTYKTVIECKDYQSKISIEKIDALIGKTRDIPDLKPVFATKVGYQSGARQKANQNRIELLIIREQNDSDWCDAEGNPLIKKICLETTLSPPAEIQDFTSLLDAAWIEDNTNLTQDQVTGSCSALNNSIVIDDLTHGERYSLWDLQYRLSDSFTGEYDTEIEEEVSFENAFIHHSNLKLKLTGYKIKYLVPKPSSEQLEIDGRKFLLGVVEYLSTGTKKKVFTPEFATLRNP